MTALVKQAWAEGGSITRDMRGLIRWYGENSFFEGLLEGGANPDQLTADDKDILDGLVAEQQQYVPNFTDAVRKAKDDAGQGPAVLQRIDLWTEAIYAIGQRGRIQAQAKLKTRMQWHTANDEMTCEICRPLNDKIVDAGKPFGNDAEGMPIYNEPAHISCRCTTTEYLE